MKILFFLLLIVSGCTNQYSEIEEKFSIHLSIPDHKAKIIKSEFKRNLFYADSAIYSWIEYKNGKDYLTSEESLTVLDKVEKYKNNSSMIIGEYWYIEYKIGEMSAQGVFPVIKEKIYSPLDTTAFNELTKESLSLIEK